MPREPAIAISGPPGAGKTTLARALARELAVPVVGFGDFVRAEAAARRRGQTRQSLQAIGEEMLERLGPDGFVTAAAGAGGLTAASRGIIWDGVRHLRVLEALQRFHSPAEVVLFYLERGAVAPVEAPTEREHPLLRAAATAVLTEQTAAAAKSAALEHLRRR